MQTFNIYHSKSKYLAYVIHESTYYNILAIFIFTLIIIMIHSLFMKDCIAAKCYIFTIRNTCTLDTYNACLN